MSFVGLIWAELQIVGVAYYECSGTGHCDDLQVYRPAWYVTDVNKDYMVHWVSHVSYTYWPLHTLPNVALILQACIGCSWYVARSLYDLVLLLFKGDARVPAV